MTQAIDSSVGQRVKATRKLRGWTQERLAQEVARYSKNVSLSLIRQVEQGRTPASQSFTAACARALQVQTSDLYDEVYPRTSRDEQQMHAGIPEIRRELATYRLPPDDVPMRPIEDLAKDVARASQLRHMVKLDELGTLLPKLLHDLRVAWYSTDGPEQERVFGLLAEAYAATSQVVYKLGYIDLSSLAVDRYEWAAARSGDLLAVLVGDYQRAGEMICAADFSSAETFLEQSRRQIEDQLGAGDPKVLSTWGNLHLKSGLAAARAGKTDTADAHLAEARETAQRLGHDRDDYRLCFGPTNVDIWSVGLAVEMMNGSEAVKRAQGLDLPASTPRERLGHHYIDLARGFLLHGDKDGCFSALQIAKKIAPTQTRYHPMVHETIRTLARQEARATDTVRGFAAWCGVTTFD
ncbi:helix-turn-helix domain-containing protein [Nocardia farcinica]|uniref:helix-turn-helix domain-containing protein n=1 Tax=Nocardia farcinica TaxID=37329 RepID=UPI001894273E|nr:helix-turn-helix transcriptional regulator [Nocardia farcinica]MBF6411011.1 helix-turn-helix transcriptional regulator [Nocardia farcinica]